MVIWLLQRQVLMQLHTFLYVLPGVDEPIHSSSTSDSRSNNTFRLSQAVA